MAYYAALRRNRQNRTNYRKRAALLLGRRSFVSVTISNQNVMAQVLKSSLTGDRVVAAVQSKQLGKYGWKGSMNSLPSCYLTGFLLGFEALKKAVDDLILYTGKKSYTSGIGACTKGIVDAGVKMPVSDSSFPSAERIRGSHIAQYAEILKRDSEKYNSKFSNLLKNGCKPENYPDHFEEIKCKIRNVQLAERTTDKSVAIHNIGDIG